MVLQGFNESLDISDYIWIFSMYFEVFNGVSNLEIEYFIMDRILNNIEISNRNIHDFLI